MNLWNKTIVYIYNLLVPKSERFNLPQGRRKKYDFTMLLVGLDKVRTVTAYDQDDAIRKIYVLLTPDQIEQLEWVEPILVRLHRKEKYNEPTR